jgi:death-on-curing protein
VVADAYFSEFYGKDGDEERGVKDPSLVLSALAAPKQTFDGKDLFPDIFSKAAALMRSLAQNHGFQNANKRTAMMATILFLEVNGYEVVAPPKKMYRLAMKVVKEKPSINSITRTLQKYSKIPEHRPISKYRQYREQVLEWWFSYFRKQ